MLIFAMCPNFFVDLLNEGGGSKRFVLRAVQKTKNVKHFGVNLVLKDLILIFVMFLDFSLDILYKVGGSNPFVERPAHRTVQ